MCLIDTMGLILAKYYIESETNTTYSPYEEPVITGAPKTEGVGNNLHAKEYKYHTKSHQANEAHG